MRRARRAPATAATAAYVSGSRTWHVEDQAGQHAAERERGARRRRRCRSRRRSSLPGRSTAAPARAARRAPCAGRSRASAGSPNRRGRRRSRSPRSPSPHRRRRASRIALSRGCAALFDTHSSIVRTVDNGSVGSRSWTFWRTTGSIEFGGASVRTTISIAARETDGRVVNRRRLPVQRGMPHVADDSDDGVDTVNCRSDDAACGRADRRRPRTASPSPG